MDNENNNWKIGDLVSTNGGTYRVVALRGDRLSCVRWVKSRKAWTKATTGLMAAWVTPTTNPEEDTL